MRRGPNESFMEEGNFKLGFENGVGFQQVKTGEGHHMLKKMSGELRRRKYMVKGEKRVRQGSRAHRGKRGTSKEALERLTNNQNSQEAFEQSDKLHFLLPLSTHSSILCSPYLSYCASAKKLP